jgi:4-hydroxy-3-methylbut-2-enyl diphosphate reductase IspH
MTIIKLGHGIEIDIDLPVDSSHNTKELLHRVIGLLHHQQKQLEEIRKKMITPEILKASSDALTQAVTDAIALIVTPGASTPDANVKTFQSDVDAQTARLVAAEGTPTPPPPPTP